ncbi:hypothetical protein [Arenibacter sp. F26102]|nr:hypothetical protein [Arenibacter sp. F26102]
MDLQQISETLAQNIVPYLLEVRRYLHQNSENQCIMAHDFV